MSPRKLSQEEQVYEDLRKVINDAPFPTPRTPSITKVLKFFFPTVKDAEIGTYLAQLPDGGGPKTAAEIAKESGKDVKQVSEVLDRLSLRGGVRKAERMGQPGIDVYTYSGSFGMSDGLGTLGKDDSQDPSGIVYKDVINQYYEEGYLLEWGASRYPPFRTLVVDKPVDTEAKVLTWEIASEIIKANDPIAMGWCNCRVRHRNCHHRIDNCFQLGPSSARSVERSREVPGARPINFVTQKEALKILEDSFKDGLVATTNNNSDPLQASFICMCCTCCCHVTGAYAVNNSGWGNPYSTMKSNFQPKVDNSKCPPGCKICVDICPVNARWRHYPHQPDLSDNYIFLEEERCFGCGICAYNCPQKALTMVRVSDITPEPDREAQWARFHRELRH